MGGEAMTVLVLSILGALAAYAMYLAAVSSRRSTDPMQHLDAGQRLPGWAYAFASTGIVLAVFEPFDHLRLLAAYGYQYNETVLGLIIVALAAALFQKRLWLASRITAARTMGELLGAYYGSPALRLYLLAVLFLFSVPGPAYFLGQAGGLPPPASPGATSRPLALSALARL